MRATLSTALGSLRAPAHTGPNRCWPCTAVNLALATGAAALAASRAPVAGAAVFAAGAAAVWLRGYVVPGTPAFTRRYLPERVLAAFEKRPAGASDDTPENPWRDPESALADLGVLRSDNPPALAPAFRDPWIDTARSLADDPAALRVAAAETLDADPAAITVSESDGGATLAVDGDWVGEWPSRTALVADVATERTLAATAWTDLDRPARADLAARVRGVAVRCPVCDAETRVSGDTVASCCRETDVRAVACPDCDARLAEFDSSRDAFAPGR